ncbi:MAG: PLP-dependent aminotransferase family protein [Alphaproteobacteria bacterium]|nr:PLP-dependent aminotransferase family protein [Alphaproteobacteria bacterium]
MDHVQPNAIGELLKFGADPELISFAGGYPDGTLFPTRQLNEVFQVAILERGAQSLQYTVSDGDPKLRNQLAARVTRLGTPCAVENLLILQGSQQGLDLVAKMLVDPGDIIVTESPTFLGALIAFNPCQPRYVGIAMDEHGMKTDELERQLKAGVRPKLLYTIPEFQNPSGVTMTAERRAHLLALAKTYDFTILEDTAYRELRYSGEAPPTLKSMDSEGRVIMLGSFSKILAPGLRLGWAVATAEVIGRLGLLKLAADTQCSTLNMAAASLFMERHDLDGHVQVLRAAYLRKKELMLDMVRRHFPQEVRCTDPDGGLFTWLTFPRGFDTARFLREQALGKAKVAFVPGAGFFPQQEEANHARFNFSGQPDEMIIKGMAALGALAKEQMAHP